MAFHDLAIVRKWIPHTLCLLISIASSFSSAETQIETGMIQPASKGSLPGMLTFVRESGEPFKVEGLLSPFVGRRVKLSAETRFDPLSGREETPYSTDMVTVDDDIANRHPSIVNLVGEIEQTSVGGPPIFTPYNQRLVSQFGRRSFYLRLPEVRPKILRTPEFYGFHDYLLDFLGGSKGTYIGKVQVVGSIEGHYLTMWGKRIINHRRSPDSGSAINVTGHLVDRARVDESYARRRVGFSQNLSSNDKALFEEGAEPSDWPYLLVLSPQSRERLATSAMVNGVEKDGWLLVNTSQITPEDGSRFSGSAANNNPVTLVGKYSEHHPFSGGGGGIITPTRVVEPRADNGSLSPVVTSICVKKLLLDAVDSDY